MGVVRLKKDGLIVGFVKDGLDANDRLALESDDRAMDDFVEHPPWFLWIL